MKLNGIVAAKGLAVGSAVVLSELPFVEQKNIQQNEIPTERKRLVKALESVRSELEELKGRLSPELQGIIRAQILFLEDPELKSEIDLYLSQGKNVEWAVEKAIDEYVQAIALLQNDYLKERAEDVKDFKRRLLAALMGMPASGVHISQPSILIAKNLPPSEIIGLDVSLVLGFITEQGGPTSHSAIIARAAGIPAMVGVMGLFHSIKNGDIVVLNATSEEILINPPNDIRISYEAKIKENTRLLLLAKSKKDLNTVTTDKREVELAANIGGSQDVASALEWGAKGAGLFRTELLYMQKDELPSEEVQYAAYKEVAERFAPDCVIFRTLDIGGDKALPYLHIPLEENPFLGYRALRLCLDRPDLFKTQLRAILRAGQHGNIKIMFPMVATLNELRQAKAILYETASELDMTQLPEIGIMVEIPSAALMASAFANEVDFFSIGSNDLIQYTMAADRGNKSVSYLYQHLEPAVLNLIAMIIKAAHNAGKWVGMCGEMAGDPEAIPFLLGLGLDEFSMGTSAIPKARELIRSLSYSECQKLSKLALACSSVAEVQLLIPEIVRGQIR